MAKLGKYYICLLLLFFVACTSPRLTILISKDTNQNIKNWITNFNSNLLIKEFYSLPVDSMAYYLNIMDGLILGGGEDVNPTLYHRPDYEEYCDPPNNYRDSLEIDLIKLAMQQKKPIIGICRGLQILNVANGGTLIPDIPSFYPSSKINHRNKKDKAHTILAIKKSWLPKKTTKNPRLVNSRHHQCIDKVANGFKVVAFSPDSVIESIELLENSTHPFAVAVQWHPESIQTDKLSKILGKKFVKKVRKFKKPKQEK